MKGLVHLIYSYVCLALNLERDFSFDNLLGVTDQPQTRVEEVRFMFASYLQPSTAQILERTEKEVTFFRQQDMAM